MQYFIKGGLAMIRILFTLLLFGMLTGCASSARTDCGLGPGWNACSRQTAVESYRYAQMAANAYESAGAFVLDPAIRVLGSSNGNDETGFAYVVFGVFTGDHLNEIVVAFRGTDAGLADWWFGNLLTRQNDRGLKVFDDWRRRYPDIPMVVAGHSLGGGIATRVSLCRPDVRSFVFNTSPRFRRCAGTMHTNERTSIVERGEILKLTRVFGREANQTYTSLDCGNGGTPFGKHSIRALAECLTRIAALDDASAKVSLDLNGLANDTEH
jgi:hypothetical protein